MDLDKVEKVWKAASGYGHSSLTKIARDSRIDRNEVEKIIYALKDQGLIDESWHGNKDFQAIGDISRFRDPDEYRDEDKAARVWRACKGSNYQSLTKIARVTGIGYDEVKKNIQQLKDQALIEEEFGGFKAIGDILDFKET